MTSLLVVACTSGGPSLSESASPGSASSPTASTAAPSLAHSPSPSPAASLPPFPSLPTVAAGVASDQPCLAELDDPTAVADVGYAAAELEALLLERTDLGIDDEHWVHDFWLSSYFDNSEVVTFDPPAEDACSVLERLGRVTGYQATYVLDLGSDGQAGDRLTQSVELFLSDAGPVVYVPWRLAALARQEPTLTTEPIGGSPAGVLARASDDRGDRSWAFVADGSLVATVAFAGQTGDTPPIGVEALIRALGARIASARPTGDPYDLSHLMSATLPKASLPDRFVGLDWDRTFSGCWDTRERLDQSADPEDEARDIETFGSQAACWSMYTPSTCDTSQSGGSPAPTATPPEGIVRVATSITVMRDREAATGYLEDSLAEYEAAATEVRPVERFDVPGVPGAVGARRYIDDAEYTDTSVWLVRGDVIGRAFIHDRTETDHAADVIAMARALDARLQVVLGTPAR